MAVLGDITDAIKVIAESVGGIGKVYDQFIQIKNSKDFKEYATSDDITNLLWFTQVPRNVSNAEGFLLETVERTFVFVAYYRYSAEDNSDKQFREMLENLVNAFNANETLNDTVSSHYKMDILTNQPAMFVDVLVHLAILELKTTETNDLEEI